MAHLHHSISPGNGSLNYSPLNSPFDTSHGFIVLVRAVRGLANKEWRRLFRLQGLHASAGLPHSVDAIEQPFIFRVDPLLRYAVFWGHLLPNPKIVFSRSAVGVGSNVVSRYYKISNLCWKHVKQLVNMFSAAQPVTASTDCKSCFLSLRTH